MRSGLFHSRRGRLEGASHGWLDRCTPRGLPHRELVAEPVEEMEIDNICINYHYQDISG